MTGERVNIGNAKWKPIRDLPAAKGVPLWRMEAIIQAILSDLAKFTCDFGCSDLQRLTAENAELRAALATARRDGWIAGRDAAAQMAEQCAIDNAVGHDQALTMRAREGFGERVGACRRIVLRIRALAPDTVEGESDG